MHPRVSIAMATYNGEKYLREQLDSLYNQTYKNIEVVVCDDCSHDGTAEILEEYRKRHGLQYYVNQKRVGFVKNFEYAISRCNGDYIALCDQDDVWLPHKIERLVEAINGHMLVCSDLYLINGKEEPITDSLFKYTKIKFFADNQFDYLVHSNFAIGCTMLFRKELKEYFLPFPEGIPYHDWWIAVVAAIKGKIGFYREPLVLYRYHGNNSTLTGERNVVESIFDKLSDVWKKMGSTYYEEKLTWFNSLIQSKLLTEKQRTYVEEIKIVYRDVLTKYFPLRATIIALKNREKMFQRRGPLKQIIFAGGIIFAGIIRLLVNGNGTTIHRQNEVLNG
ncbi:MAG: glycosyltransferase family 2 protein [Spirochaetes bacterium]|nr:glycosyltransferase family 2 protein [Spirochaetota bacterium]